jgi:hypothetical protein
MPVPIAGLSKLIKKLEHRSAKAKQDHHCQRKQRVESVQSVLPTPPNAPSWVIKPGTPHMEF